MEKVKFYDIYTEQQKAQDPAKRNTGIFFFRGKPNTPFAVVCPGDGFSYVGSLHESFPLAQRISELGLGTGTDADGWLDLAVRFWQKHINE